jgi:hypothetical protein
MTPKNAPLIASPTSLSRQSWTAIARMRTATATPAHANHLRGAFSHVSASLVQPRKLISNRIGPRCATLNPAAGPDSHFRLLKVKADPADERALIVGQLAGAGAACFNAQSSAKSATASHPGSRATKCGPSNSTISVTDFDL